MSHIIQCIEAQARPSRLTIQIEPAESLCVYLLQDPEVEDSRLRATILRKGDELGPQGSTLLFEASVVDAGRQRLLRVQRVGRIAVEHLRPDIRSRVANGSELKTGTRFEIAIPGSRTIQFSLLLVAQVSQGVKMSVGGGGTRSSAASSAQTGVLWLVPSALQIIRNPAEVFKDGAIEWLGKSGISARTFAILTSFALTMLTSVGVAAWQYLQAKDARKAAAAAQQDAEQSRESAKAALASEALCLADRQALARQAGLREKRIDARIRETLGASAARTMAIETGGMSFAAPELAPYDTFAVDSDVKVLRVLWDSVAPLNEERRRCFESAERLRDDEPRFLVFSYPDPARSCPQPDSAFILDGSSVLGRWGVSERLAAEFQDTALSAASVDLPEGVDPRSIDRMAISMLTASFRAVRQALLRTETAGRPALAPSELSLWSLALVQAANRMPRTPDGAPHAGIEECTSELLTDLLGLSVSPKLGEPILPPLGEVMEGRVKVEASATASCPWPPGALENGVRAALVSVAGTARADEESAGDDQKSQEQ